MSYVAKCSKWVCAVWQGKEEWDGLREMCVGVGGCRGVLCSVWC